MKILALYDETCALCQESKKLFRRLDRLNKVEWVSLQTYERLNKSFPFTKEDLRKELHIILPNQKIVKGFYAVRRLLLTSPVFTIIATLLYIPFVPLIGVPAYKLIAKNRHRFLKRKCEDGSCSL
ncbi:DUF393 domain-containing protein [Cytobacillus spongiae]|jgi:predicted DCC family thiol-disulfide oxidoreductase YuxK|uniref:thiol-disulfide oxidoreductase DCC family protein n=1 Tax=Cytobacillus spongiae TaxID=2901381 RepID=UPI001F17EDE6|nr:DUF393 domain-containing protein [Cytobacillus spongiae]UII55289.1 DUF393 domain-containing protein [Cytobacillus spongiae]